MPTWQLRYGLLELRCRKDPYGIRIPGSFRGAFRMEMVIIKYYSAGHRLIHCAGRSRKLGPKWVLRAITNALAPLHIPPSCEM